MNTAHKQRGLSGLGYLVVLLVIGFFLTAMIKVLPIYMDSWTLKSAIEAALEKEGAGGEGKTPREIRKAIDRQFTVNQIVAISARDIKITRQKGGTLLVDANYEKRVPFMQNLDVIVKFENFQFEAKGRR